MFIFRAAVSAVSCLVVPAFICIDVHFSSALKLNDDDDDIKIVCCVTNKSATSVQQVGNFTVYGKTTGKRV